MQVCCVMGVFWSLTYDWRLFRTGSCLPMAGDGHADVGTLRSYGCMAGMHYRALGSLDPAIGEHGAPSRLFAFATVSGPLPGPLTLVK